MDTNIQKETPAVTKLRLLTLKANFAIKRKPTNCDIPCKIEMINEKRPVFKNNNTKTFLKKLN